MRRLSESNREKAEAEASATTAPFLSATPKRNAGADPKEGARKTALLFACSTLEEQAYLVLASDHQG